MGNIEQGEEDNQQVQTTKMTKTSNLGVEKRKKTSQEVLQSKILVWLILFIGGIFLISGVSAFEFDNVVNTYNIGKGNSLSLGEKEVSYNPLWEKYKPVEIVNAFGLGSTLMEGYIDKHKETCSDDCESSFVIKLADKGVLVQNVRFKRLLNGNWIDTNIRSYDLYLKTSEEEIIVEDKDYVCVDNGKVNVNGTKILDCEYKVIGTHKENKPIWGKYIEGTEVNAGVYEVKIVGNKKGTWEVDWQIKTQGKWIEEWAAWGGTSITYYISDTFSASNTTLWNYSGTSGVSGGYLDIGEHNAVWEHAYTNTYFSIPLNTGEYLNFTFYITGASGGDLFDANYNQQNDIGEKSGTGIYENYDGGGIWEFYQTNSSGGYNKYYDCVLSCGHFNLVTIIANNTETAVYFDGVLKQRTYRTYLSSGRVAFGGWGGGGSSYKIDYVYLSKVGGNSITLNSPAEGYVSPIPLVEFNCSVNLQGATFSNISLWTNQSGSFTMVNSTTTNGALMSSTFINDGKYLWSCRGCDTDGDCGFASNRTLYLDTTTPTINILSPPTTISYGINGLNTTLSYQVNDTNLGSCWYDYNGVNNSIPCTSEKLNVSSFIFSNPIKSIIVYANDTAGNIGSQSRSWNYILFENNQTYNPTSNPNTYENITINVTYDSSTYSGVPTGTIYYNGTSYTGTLSGVGNTRTFTSSVVVPYYSTAQNLSFYWTIGLLTGEGTPTYINTTTRYQYSIPTTPIEVATSCGTGMNASFNFIFKDETTLSSITSNVSYIFRYGYSGNTSGTTINGSLSNVNSFTLCTNWSEPSYSVGYGEIQYGGSDYTSKRWYVFRNTRATNETIQNNLYMLTNTLATSFLLQVQDNQLNNYVGYYVSLLRWYPNLNEYRVVEMAKTDDKGQSVVRVKTEDADYRFGVYEIDGTLTHLVNPLRMVCLVSPCSYTIYVTGTSIDYNSVNNIQINITYNETTKKALLIWNDPSQDTSSMNFLIWKTGVTETLVCNETAEGFTGILECNLTGQTGSLRAEAWRSASPSIPLAQKFIDLRTKLIDATTGTNTNGKAIAIFIVIILVMLTALMGIYSPLASVILGLIALIPAVYIGAITPIIAVGFGILGGIVLHFLKQT